MFDEWKSGVEVLHYFDNFPTAAVVPRARRLREYLAKRIARGEIFKNDDITLVGHSTGGLDIRLLLSDLYKLQDQNELILVDGMEVDPEELIHSIHRVVFLSVPQWGTNIADWVKAQWLWPHAIIEELRAMVAGSQLSPLERVESIILGGTASITRAPVYRAVQDALDEANENNGEQSPFRKAEAQEAASELALYLQHMATDFGAIYDLTSCPPRSRERTDHTSKSPAHYSRRDRDLELQQLREKYDIEFRSYVTIGKCPFRFDPGRPVPTWKLANLSTYPVADMDPELWAGTDCMYRACYRACAGGPFDPPKESREKAKSLRPKSTIQIWDNDGIVNTLSMFWPLGKHVLVHADHMDIVGQFEPLKADPGHGRANRTYDLLKSDSGFDRDVFDGIWNDIFAFALGRSDAHRTFAAAAGRG